MMTLVVQLLLLVVLARAQHYLCRQEKDKMSYYIYAVPLQVEAYYCLINSECKHVPNSIEIKKVLYKFVSNCTGRVSIRNGPARKRQVKLCKILGQMEVKEDEVTLSGNKTCSYSGGYCFDDNVPSDIYWEFVNVCDLLYPVYKGAFTVWTLAQNKTKFIKNNYVSIKLTGKISLCGKEVWMTDSKKYFVFTEEIKEVVSKKFIFNSTIPEECAAKPAKPKVWYLYKYPKDVTGYFCNENSTDSCEKTGSEGVGNNSKLLILCKDYLCNSASCREHELSFSLCKKSLSVNFENDTIQELPGCTYSAGHCPNRKAFWAALDPCRSISFSFMGYSTENGITRHVVFVKNSTKFTLERMGVLCNVSIWYTNKNGYIASEHQLLPLPEHKTPTTEALEVILYANEKELSDIQVFIYSTIFFVVLFVLWYVFGVIVNCFSLRRFNKGRTRKTSFLNTVCQSLMSRHLFFPQSDVEILNSPSAVTVDNDLYCLTH